MCSYTTVWFIVITVHVSGYRYFLTLIFHKVVMVVPLVRCGEIFNANFIVNFLTNQPVKELWKSADIWRSYRKSKKRDVFWDTVYFYYILKFFGPLCPSSLPIRAKFSKLEWTKDLLIRAKFSPHRFTQSPLGQKNFNTFSTLTSLGGVTQL